MSNKNAPLLKAVVRGTYDLQKLRIQLGNRICAEWREQNGQKSGEKTEELTDTAKNVMKDIHGAYKRLTDGLVRLPTPAKFKSDKVISSYTMLVLVDQYDQMLRDEDKHFNRLDKVLSEFDIWNKYLKGVRGVGPAMAGVIISEIDIFKATYPSSIFRYAGLDVVRNEDGTVEGRSRKSHHLEDQTYIDAEGKERTKKGITFNPFLKTKLVGVLGGSFIKQPADKCEYRKIYDDYKNRLENMPEHQTHYDVSIKGKDIPKGHYTNLTNVGKKKVELLNDKKQVKNFFVLNHNLSKEDAKLVKVEVSGKSKGHRHNMANRYMVKMFIVNLYMEWRKIEGLPVYGTYAEEKLGIKHKKIGL